METHLRLIKQLTLQMVGPGEHISKATTLQLGRTKETHLRDNHLTTWSDQGNTPLRQPPYKWSDQENTPQATKTADLTNRQITTTTYIIEHKYLPYNWSAMSCTLHVTMLDIACIFNGQRDDVRSNDTIRVCAN